MRRCAAVDAGREVGDVLRAALSVGRRDVVQPGGRAGSSAGVSAAFGRLVVLGVRAAAAR